MSSESLDGRWTMEESVFERPLGGDASSMPVKLVLNVQWDSEIVGNIHGAIPRGSRADQTSGGGRADYRDISVSQRVVHDHHARPSSSFH